MAVPERIEPAINASLRADVDIQAICENRVYHLKIPQGTILPAVVHQRVYSSPYNTLMGYGSEGVTLMLNSFAVTWDEAKDLALAVRGAMSREPICAIFLNERDIMNETGDVFCISAEYACHQLGGYCHVHD